MKVLRLMLMMFFVFLMISLAEAKSTTIKQGEKAPYSGYLFDSVTGKNIAEGWAKSQADADSYKKAYESLKSETEESVKILGEIVETDRQMYMRKRKEARQKARWNSIQWFVIGGILGSVVYNNR